MYGTIVFVKRNNFEIHLWKLFKKTKWNELVHAKICENLIYQTGFDKLLIYVGKCSDEALQLLKEKGSPVDNYIKQWREKEQKKIEEKELAIPDERI